MVEDEIARPSSPADRSIRIRMYRQGLGDCFLVTLPKDDDGWFHLLIDCGVLLGTQDKDTRMKAVLENIIQDTKGRVDVLAITHEHYDHISGLLLAGDLFSERGRAVPGKLQVDEVWFAWTEDPTDPLGKQLRSLREKRIQTLASVTSRLANLGAAPDLVSGLEGVLGFFGAGRSSPGATARAMAKAAASGGRCRYHRPTNSPWTSPEVPGIRIWVLGPPRDERLLKRELVRDDVYHLAAASGDAAASALAAFAGDAGVEDGHAPFDGGYGVRLDQPESLVIATQSMTTVASEYSDPANDWRRIDDDWIGAIGELALQLDSATNNTSLVLAIEVIDCGEVYLFAADAQGGNWESWQELAWRLDEHTEVTGPDLLRRTVFYKVGHHGSHNATLRRKGLEMMSEDLVAFLPVDQTMARSRNWNRMPLPGLLEELQRKTRGRVVRLDAPLPPGLLGVSAATENFPGTSPDPLYYEWVKAI